MRRKKKPPQRTSISPAKSRLKSEPRFSVSVSSNPVSPPAENEPSKVLVFSHPPYFQVPCTDIVRPGPYFAAGCPLLRYPKLQAVLSQPYRSRPMQEKFAEERRSASTRSLQGMKTHRQLTSRTGILHESLLLSLEETRDVRYLLTAALPAAPPALAPKIDFAMFAERFAIF